MRFHPAHFAALLVAMLFVGPAAAGQEGTDMKLEDMGFIMRPTTTPTQMDGCACSRHASLFVAQKGIAAIISTPIPTFAGAYLSAMNWR